MQVSGGGGGPNYNPTRDQFPGIVNRHPGMFPAVRDPWTVVEANIVRGCRSESEIGMNIPVARQLYEYCEENEIEARELEAYPIAFSVGPKLLAWSPALFVYKDRITVPFLDLRRSKNLSREAQRLIFSLQHQAIRVNNPDYADVEMEIFRFSNDAARTLVSTREGNRWLFSYDELETIISETQKLWLEVLAVQGRSFDNDDDEGFRF